MRTLSSRIRALFIRGQLDARLDEEVQAHLDEWDPTTLLGVLSLLIAVTAGASYIPARRAMRLNPVAVLRND